MDSLGGSCSESGLKGMFRKHNTRNTVVSDTELVHTQLCPFQMQRRRPKAGPHLWERLTGFIQWKWKQWEGTVTLTREARSIGSGAPSSLRLELHFQGWAGESVSSSLQMEASLLFWQAWLLLGGWDAATFLFHNVLQEMFRMQLN